jgi:hypothetical protein
MARKKKEQFIELNKAQKDEIRRLTQFANRRIVSAEKTYSKAGKTILPKEVVGNIRTKADWYTDKQPLSRTEKFKTASEYRKHMNFLRSFEKSRPNMQQYTKAQREKTKLGVETSMGRLPEELEKQINKMSAPELSEFWKTFSDNSTKLAFNYSSDSALFMTTSEYFREDINAVATRGKGG